MNLDAALELAQKGFRVFPVKTNAKKPPLIEDFKNQATTDTKQLKEWWARWPKANVGISTRDLVVIDEDNSPGKHGAETVLELELQGKVIPPTLTFKTPTGGKHYVYRAPFPLKQGASILGEHLDIRGDRGYIVGPGSVIDGKKYVVEIETEIKDCPSWVVDVCGPTDQTSTRVSINEDAAANRAKDILRSIPAAESGKRNELAFIAAAKVKDAGVSETLTLYLMLDFFKCNPPLDIDELRAVVHSAFKYGSNTPGVSSPEVAFASNEELPQVAQLSPQKHPFDVLNESFAFVVLGGGPFILWESTDHKGSLALRFLPIQTFDQKFANWTMHYGDNKQYQVTKQWLKSPGRRSYDGVCFSPGGRIPKKFYNLWRGFAHEPLIGEPSTKAKHAVDMFLEHALQNVCKNDEGLFQWLIGFFAHMIQRPEEKPLVSLVFRGGKGVGKNTLLDCVGALLGQHYITASDKRWLTGNFNSHLEQCMLFVLDEAFWSGDKSAEGVLKALVTSKKQLIERKGLEAYTVDSYLRVAIIGNETWLIPAGPDERRYAVFDVGDGRKQDTFFFKTMRESMEAGGYSYLLRYLKEFDISKIDVNIAPTTEGLLDQKLESLAPLDQYWFDSLRAGRLLGSDLPGWVESVPREKFRDAFRRHCTSRQINSRLPNEVWIGRQLFALCPAMKSVTNDYRLPDLATARKQFEKYLKHTIDWD